MGEVRLTGNQDVPVAVIDKTMPGLRVRMLADRHSGTVLWESYLLDDDGTEVGQSDVRLTLPHLLHLEEIVELLFEAREELSPRRRPDRAKLEEPPEVPHIVRGRRATHGARHGREGRGS